ncbi:Coatomer beta subunit [Parasponia andersonii]|uniref:Coatomer beta subunit n=1 Tax=Parasponia andersonii TaxID=3476 RepID=A0A2P5BCP8_PARAD|nr:Coatomer beta subunit [Parasponia andersonii]
MGINVLPCRLPCTHHSNKDSEPDHYSSSSSNHHQLHSESSTSSSSSFLSSQPSLPSVPSLHHHNLNLSTNHCHVITLKPSPPNSSYVSSLVLAGKFLYGAFSDGQIRLWSRDPDKLNNGGNPFPPENPIAVAVSSVKSLVFSGDKLFTAHQDNKVRVWKVNDVDHDQKYYKCVATLPTLNDRLLALFSAKNYVQVRRHKSRTWVHHVDAVSALAVSRDGSLLYSASWDRSFKVWRTSDFKCLESVTNAHDDAINHVALSHDGHVYTGSADKKIKVWKRAKLDGSSSVKHSLEATLEKHKSAVNALALSSDGLVLYSGACDRSILVWERSSDGSHEEGGADGGGDMIVVGALRGHTKAILCLAVVSFDLVCSGSADRTVRVWNRSGGVDKSYACLAVLEGHRRPVKCLTATLDNNGSSSSSERSCVSSGTSYLIYSGSLDCDIKVWRIWVS